MESVDYTSPLYLQVRGLILSKIESGEYAPGKAIPSENEFAEMLGINRLTIRAALDELIDRDIIRTVHGKGSFVVGKKISRDLERLEGFTQTMNGRNITPAIKVLKKKRRQAGDFYANLFEINPQEDIYYIERLCYADDEILSLEEIVVPASILPKMEGIDLSVFSLSEVYEFYGVKLEKAKQRLEIVKLGKREARLLKVELHDPALMVDCFTYSKDKIIEFSRSYTIADKCEYTVHFNKNMNKETD